MFLERAPRPSLRPFVKSLWVCLELPRPGVERELLLPSATLRIVFRLTHALRTFTTADAALGHDAGFVNVGGPRATAYVRDVSRPALSVGAELEPGAGAWFLGVPADELAARHTPLCELWGAEAALTRERLLETATPARQLDVLEAALLARLAQVPSYSPVLAQALTCFAQRSEVSDVVAASRYSHRHFVELFRRSVGLPPKLYTRVARFQRALKLARGARAPSWAELAVLAGYSDQAHFNREFREFTGLSPGAYQRLGARFANHVPLLESQPSAGQKSSRRGAAQPAGWSDMSREVR